MTSTVIKLPSTCAAGDEIELALYDNFDADAEKVTIDMQEVTFLTTTSIIYLIALTNQLHKQNKEIEFRLPQNEEKR